MIPNNENKPDLCGRCGDRRDAIEHARGAIKSAIIALALAEIIDHRVADLLIELLKFEDA